MLGIFLNICKG